MTQKALIIAAGSGTRLRQNGGKDVPKPLQTVAGLPLLTRIILTAKKAGIAEFVVVVGFEKERLMEVLTDKTLGVRIDFVENPDWQKPNGISVLAAKNHLRENFVLLMADHIFDPKILEAFTQVPLQGNKALLAVDYKIKSVFDINDATKVLVKKGQIEKIAKNLPDFNAIDTGMFLCTPALFDALEEVKKQKNTCSLSDGIQLLSVRGQMGTFDIGDADWCDVDTPEALKHAEKKLFNACRKSTDGIISRNFNRFISLAITRLLIKTPLSANHVTGITFLMGLLSGFFVAKGDYLNGVLGAFLFKLSSILDGCDGEMSKLKMTSSKLGQWLDTLSDNLTYVVFLVGVAIGVTRQQNPYIGIIGPLALFGWVMSLVIILAYVVCHTNSGSLLVMQKDFNTLPDTSWVKKIFGKVVFMAKRDFFALAFFVIALLGRLDIILWMCAVGANLTWVAFVSTWLTSLKNRRGLSSPPVHGT